MLFWCQECVSGRRNFCGFHPDRRRQRCSRYCKSSSKPHTRFNFNTFQVSHAAERFEDFVRSNRTRANSIQGSDRPISMHEGLLIHESDPASEPMELSSVRTRQKKSPSAPEVHIPSSLSQLENVVRCFLCSVLRSFQFNTCCFRLHLPQTQIY
jgi:hypothetical protein